MKRIVFTGGGSAGHVIPNVALMEELLSDGETDIFYVGSNGIEKGIVAQWQVPYFEIECPKLVRGGGWQGFKQNLKIPAAFFRAVKKAKEGLLAFRPDAVFSKGGYVALPVVIAAHKLKIPCYAHESDFSVGLANRLSAPFCKRIFTSFPETAKKLRRGVYSGAPLRRAVLSSTKAEARRKLNIPFTANVVLIFGGGSGSAVINAEIRKNLKTLTEKYLLLHVCGKGNKIESNLENYRQYEFVSDMGALYAASDLVVARAGAGTVFEILALKKPSVLIPLEGQTRGDQSENAAYFSRKGLCLALKQSSLSLLPEKIETALHDRTLKEKLAASSFTSGNEVILNELRATIAKDDGKKK